MIFFLRTTTVSLSRGVDYKQWVRCLRSHLKSQSYDPCVSRCRSFGTTHRPNNNESSNNWPPPSSNVAENSAVALPEGSLAPSRFDPGELFLPPGTSSDEDSAKAIAAHQWYVEGPTAESTEPFAHKVLRWLDITGFFSRWSSRKYWCLTAPPLLRLESVMMTEFERKVHLFREVNLKIFFLATLTLGYTFYYYRNARQPLPLPHGMDQPYRAVMGAYSTLPFMYPKKRCPSCRIYDPECKMACFEKLRAAGHKLFLDNTRFRAWSTPRVHLKPPPLADSVSTTSA